MTRFNKNTAEQDVSNRFEGVRVITLNMGPFKKGAAMTVPGVGIFVGKENRNNVDLLRHEFGHILQYKSWGFRRFWFHVAPASLKSAYRAQKKRGIHKTNWAEWSANRLAYNYFKQPKNWDFAHYPTAAFRESPRSYPQFSKNREDFEKKWLNA